MGVSASAYFIGAKFGGDYEAKQENGEQAEEESKSIFNKEVESGEYEGFDYSQFDDIEEGQFVYVVNRNIYMENGESDANVMIINPEQNDFFISIDIEVNNEVVYSSGIIKRNSYLESDTFDKVLEAGEYEAVGKVTAYDTVEAEVVDTYETQLNITVAN